MMLMALFSSGAWAQFSGGSGSESNPYQISSSTDWNTLATNVNSGTSYSGKYFKLTSNITISGSTQNYMVGTMSGETSSGNAFSGNFNGDGHTITISYSTNSSFYYTAPFRYISGATIKNVKVAGTMNVYKFMGSLVGYCMGTNNIENCVSEVAITGTISGDATMGGLISHVHGGTTYIRGCVFKGKLLGSSSNCVGGFIGWTDHGSAYSEFYDCVFAPSQVTVSTTNSATFSRSNNSNTSGVYFYNCFYSQPINTTQGSKLQYTITAGSNVGTVALGNNPVEYNLSGITGYNSSSGYGIKYNNTIYAASGNSVKLNLSSTLNNPQYSASAGSLSGTGNPYTLSMTSSNTVISATDGGSSGGGGDGTLTVYDGTATSRNVPMYVYYFDDFTRSQFVIPAADLTDMAGGTINSIKFYTKSDNIPYTTVSDFDIYVKEVNYTTINALEAKSSATIVYQGKGNFVTEGSGGSITITFSTPFTYNGGNLLIGCDNTTDTGYKSIYFYGQEVTGASTGTSNGNSLDQVGFLQQNFIPKTTFFYTPASSETCEDFESGSMPSGWTSEGTGSWVVKTGDYASSTGAHGGTYNVSRRHANRNEVCYLVMPAQDFSAVSSATLNFWYINRKWGSDIDYLDVCYRIGNGNWTSLWNTTTNHESWTEQSVNLTGLAANYQIGFKYTDNYGYDVSIDDVCIETTGGSTPTYITEIATVVDWEAFCAAVNSGYSYSGETVTMTDDVTTAVTTMAGTSSNPFKGTFDGKGHTLNVNLSSSSEGFVAPFHYVTGATIKNLQVTGSCVSSASGNTRRHNAGLVGSVVATGVTVENCLVTANVGSTSYKTDYCGGLIGHGHDGNIIIKGSVYTGTLYVSGTKLVGGLLGWADTPSAVTITDCFFGGTYSNTDSGWFHPLGVANYSNNISSSNLSISNCYYTYDPSDFSSSNTDKPIVVNSTNKGKHAYTITGGSNVTVTNAGTVTTYGGSTTSVHYITGYGTGIKYNNVLYAGSGDQVSLNLNGSDEYQADHGTLTQSGNNWSLAMEAYDTKISAIACATPTAFTYTALGSTYVTLTWTAGDEEENWQVKYWANGDSEPADGQARSYSVTTCTITGLTLGVTYHAKVRAVCDAQNNEYSDWVQCDFKTSNKTFTNNYIDASHHGDGQWSTPTNWNPVGVPTTDDDVTIAANVTIGDDVLAQAHNITNTNATITIADGGQLWHSNANPITVTIQKAIAAPSQYTGTNLGFEIISFPVNNLRPSSSAITGLLTQSDYDFFYFDPTNYDYDCSQYLEWMQVDANEDMPLLQGFLYANAANTTISVTGPVMSSASVYTSADEVESSGSDPLSGWALLGNPFVCNAYVTAANGNELNFYKIGRNVSSRGDEFVPFSSGDVVDPMGGVMIYAAEDDYVSYRRTETEPQQSGRSGILNVDVRKVNSRTEMGNLDRARLRFGTGRNLPKLQLDPKHTKVYIPEGTKGYAVYYTEGAGSMPVNFKAENNGHYTLSFSTEDVNFNYLHLIDNMTGTDVDLLAGASTGSATYTFNAKTTDYESRFKLVFAASDVDGSSTGSETFAFYSNGVWVVNNEGDATLQVVDINGRILSSERISGATTKAINAASGIYMLRLINGDNVKVQKIVVRR